MTVFNKLSHRETSQRDPSNTYRWGNNCWRLHRGTCQRNFFNNLSLGLAFLQDVSGLVSRLTVFDNLSRRGASPRNSSNNSRLGQYFSIGSTARTFQKDFTNNLSLGRQFLGDVSGPVSRLTVFNNLRRRGTSQRDFSNNLALGKRH